MRFTFKAALAAIVLSFTTHTARAEEADDGWDCKAKPMFVHGSPEIGWTVVCDDVVWLCPPEADDDEGVVVQSECGKAVPSSPVEPAATPPASVPTPPSALSHVERPAPSPTPRFPISGLPASETDPPLMAYSQQPMVDIRWNLCDECARVQLDPNRTYVIYGPDGSPVSIFNRDRVRTVVGDLNGDGLINAVEATGTPATWPNQNIVWLIGTSGQNVPVTFREVREDAGRPGYWRLGSATHHRVVYGNLPGAQNHLAVR